MKLRVPRFQLATRRWEESARRCPRSTYKTRYWVEGNLLSGAAVIIRDCLRVKRYQEVAIRVFRFY